MTRRIARELLEHDLDNNEDDDLEDDDLEHDDLEDDDLEDDDLEDDIPPLRAVAAPQVLNEIIAEAAFPLLEVRVGAIGVARLRRGAIAVLMGGPGAGKSTLAIAMLVEHARAYGPAIYVSHELTRVEIGGRIVGMSCDAAWEEALSNRVPQPDMERALALPRLRILDGSCASFANLELEILALAEEHPGEPILVAVDYLQIMEPRHEPRRRESSARSRVESVVEELRQVTQRHRVVTLAVSQTSRQAAGNLRTGEMVGAQTMSAGAESSAIERAAYVTLAIGRHGDPDANGGSPVELHLGKCRMGIGDRVIPMHYDGRSGIWSVAGAALPAAQVRASRVAQREHEQTCALRLTLTAIADGSTRPLAREELARQAGRQIQAAREVIRALIADGSLVEVEQNARRSKARLIWTAEKALAAKIPIVEVAS